MLSKVIAYRCLMMGRLLMKLRLVSHEVVSERDLMPSNKIHKPILVYRFSTVT